MFITLLLTLVALIVVVDDDDNDRFGLQLINDSLSLVCLSSVRGNSHEKITIKSIRKEILNEINKINIGMHFCVIHDEWPQKITTTQCYREK